jgi:phage gp16-like protein
MKVEMANITKAQIVRLQVLRRELNMSDDLYRDMLMSATDGRTNSSTQLTQKEAFEIIDQLSKLTSKEPDPADKMRKKIISMAHSIGWVTPVATANGPVVKADIVRINAWCQKSGYLHKKLNQYTYAELPKLVSQFQEVYNSYQKQKV